MNICVCIATTHDEIAFQLANTPDANLETFTFQKSEYYIFQRRPKHDAVVHVLGEVEAKIRKIELAVALLVTVLAITVVPVYAWFSHQRELAELQLIKSPDLLYIASANAEAIKNLDMSGINVEATKIVNGNTVNITSKMFPFCVAGDYAPSFTLQLAHTSNNPFKYEIFEGTVYTSEAAAQATGKEYVEYNVTYNLTGINVDGLNRDSVTAGDILYIVKGSSLQTGSQSNTGGFTGRYLNMSSDNRTATTKYLEECYGDYNIYTNYELPLYWQCSNIPSVADPLNHGSTFFKTFIIEVSWTSEARNSKETDIVYMMAYTVSN